MASLEKIVSSPEQLHDVATLLSDLEAHEIELEIQNRDLRDMQKKLEESAGQYRLLYDGAPVAYLTLSRAALIENANIKAAALFDLERAALVGRPLILLVAPEARPKVLAHVRRVFEGLCVDDEIVTPTGPSARVLRLCSQPALDVDGAVVAAHTVVTDITMSRRAEDKLRWLCGAGELMARCTDEVETLQEVAQRAVPTIADACSFDVTTEDGARYVAAAAVDDLTRKALFQNPPDSAKLRVPLVVERHIVGELSLLMTESGRVFMPADYELARDLAARASTAIESARRLWRMRHAVEARENVLGVVSHDLKNPLGAATLSLEVLLRQAPEGGERRQGKAQLESAVRALRRMDRLVCDLLDFSKIEAGTLTLEAGSVDVKEIVDEVIGNESVHAKARGVTITSDIDTQVDPAMQAFLEEDAAVALAAGRIPGDRERLMQVFSNLIGNAVKFTPRDGTVTLRARADVDALTVEVIDAGCGIEADELRELFLPYTQSKKSKHGRGLGLYIARAIVRAHGGDLTVESTPQRGTTFRVRLPVSALRPASPQPPPSPVFSS